MNKGRKIKKYVSAGVQKTPSMPFDVRGNVYLPDSEAGSSWYETDQKPFHAEGVLTPKREPMTIPLNTALIFLCALFVVFGAMTLSRAVRKSALAKNITVMEQHIQEIQRSNDELAPLLAEARDMARIGFAATQLEMKPSADAKTIAVHAPDTRPYRENETATAGVKTGSR